MEDRIQKANDGAYNNLLVILLALAAAYLLISGFNKSKKQTYLDSAGLDTNTQQAQALRDAMNRSGISLLMQVDDTDVELIMQTAAQITDYTKVSDSYRVLYNSELTVDLQSELSRTDLQKFYDIVYKRGSNPTTAVTSPLAGKSVKALQTVNVRVFSKPSVVDHQAKTGELVGTYSGEADLTVTGTKGRFVIVDTPGLLGLYTVKFYVLKSAVKIG